MTHQHSASAPDGTPIAWSSHGPAGASPAVVLVHGITENAASWQPVTGRLGAGHRVITLDLRGHGESGTAERYDLEAMVGDVAAVIAAAGAGAPHLVGHSLGGAVASAAGAVLPAASIVNVDQSLQLGAFKEQLAPAEAMLRDAASFPAVIAQIFDGMRGELSPAETERIAALRRPDQQVVLGVWDLMFTMTEAEIAQVLDSALADYGSVPYLSLFGLDPGPGYGEWLGARIPNSTVELWHGVGHYPHLVDPDRFVRRLERFWADAT